MTEPRFERCARMVGEAGLIRLAAARVAVFGMGGVGSFCAEALARSGVGTLRLVDHDLVSASNSNRQLHALDSTLGRAKVAVMAARLLDIAPELRVEPSRVFFAAETADELLTPHFDWVVDAIDSLGPKVELLVQCQRRQLRVVTALGAGGRMDPTAVRLAPLASTRLDPLGVQVRKRVRRQVTLEGIAAAYSEELPRTAASGPWEAMTDDLVRGRQRTIQPSLVMVPAAMGMAIAAHVVRAIVE